MKARRAMMVGTWISKQIFQYIEKPIVHKQVLNILQKNKNRFLYACNEVQNKISYRDLMGSRLSQCPFVKTPLPGDVSDDCARTLFCPGNAFCMYAPICPHLKMIINNVPYEIMQNARHGEFYLERWASDQSDAFFLDAYIQLIAEIRALADTDLVKEFHRIATVVAEARGQYGREYL